MSQFYIFDSGNAVNEEAFTHTQTHPQKWIFKIVKKAECDEIFSIWIKKYLFEIIQKEICGT